MLLTFVSVEGVAAPVVPTSSLEQKVQTLDSEIRKLWVQRKVNKNNIKELKNSVQDLRNSVQDLRNSMKKKEDVLQGELKSIKEQLNTLNAGVVGLKERISSVEKTNEASVIKLENKLEKKLDLRLSGIEKGPEASKKSENLQEEFLSSREIALSLACFALLLAFLSSVFAFNSTRKSLKRIAQIEGNQEKNLEKDSQLLQAVSANSEKFSELIKGLSESIQSQPLVMADDDSKTDLVKLIAD